MFSTTVFGVAFMGGADVAEGAFQGFVFDCPDFFGVLADVVTDCFDDLIHVLVSLKLVMGLVGIDDDQLKEDGAESMEGGSTTLLVPHLIFAASLYLLFTVGQYHARSSLR